jgi:hypothetical protein
MQIQLKGDSPSCTNLQFNFGFVQDLRLCVSLDFGQI